MSVNCSGTTSRKTSGSPATATPPKQISIVSSRQPSQKNNEVQQTVKIQGVDPKVYEELKRELEEIRQQLSESDDVVAGLEKERDFYFTKLRKIEVVCQDDEAAGIIQVSKLLQVK